MKPISAFSIFTFASTVLAAPTKEITYNPPPGGWKSVDYPKGTGEGLEHYPAPPGGWENVNYPDGTGENLEHYPAPPGGWEAVKYPPGTGEKVPSRPPKGYPKPDDNDDDKDDDKRFTSQYTIEATPEQVVNGTQPTGGLPGASATYKLMLNSALNFLCYDITLRNFRGEYQSPALTATHLHEAARGASGPPRIVFADPVARSSDASERRSSACIRGPFRTGLNDSATGADSGIGFDVAMIERNPSAFMVDVHSSLAPPGAVRGQIA